MSIFALQSIVGGFLDEDLQNFNKHFDDWCVQFDSYEDAMVILQTMEDQQSIVIVEITPLSYPKYFFASLQGTIYLTRQIKDTIICTVEPYIGASFKIAICDIKTGKARFTKTNYKSITNVEAAFSNFGSFDK